MALYRGMDGSQPISPDGARVTRQTEDRRLSGSWRLATGTLACNHCDAPVAPGPRLSPADSLRCPYCDHEARARDFLSLSAPSRPARVQVRVLAPVRRRVG